MPDAHAKHFQCRHIFADGHRCGSKCLREENFCFYHYRSHKPRILPEQRDILSTFDLPALEDRSAIQAAITLIAQRIANGCLDSKRAGLLLYALQTASLNLPKPAAEPPGSVDEIELDEVGAMIAPVCEYATRPRDKTLEDILQEQWLKDEDEEAARAAAKTLAELKRQAAAESFTLPALYAVASTPCFARKQLGERKKKSRSSSRMTSKKGKNKSGCRAARARHVQALGPTIGSQAEVR